MFIWFFPTLEKVKYDIKMWLHLFLNVNTITKKRLKMIKNKD